MWRAIVSPGLYSAVERTTSILVPERSARFISLRFGGSCACAKFVSAATATKTASHLAAVVMLSSLAKGGDDSRDWSEGEGASLVIASVAKQFSSSRGAGLLRRGACHRAGHFGPDPLAPRNDEMQSSGWHAAEITAAARLRPSGRRRRRGRLGGLRGLPRPRATGRGGCRRRRRSCPRRCDSRRSRRR